jgi:hypothetical protein
MRILSRIRPHIGRSGGQVISAVRCAGTEDANHLDRSACIEVRVGVRRCVGRWRIEVGVNVPKEQGINLLVGPRGPWLQLVLRGGIASLEGLLLACSGQAEGGCFPSKRLHNAGLELAVADPSCSDRPYCDSGARLILLGS